MKVLKSILMMLVASFMMNGSVFASERLFTYTYEPETMPQGAFEFEQWTTGSGPRTKAVGQEGYNRWDFRQEFEYGVNDNYTVALVVDNEWENFRDVEEDKHVSDFFFDGVGFENKVMVINPATNPVGLTLYIEPKVSGREFELEEKIILGQRIWENWKWALNVTHETKWSHDFDQTEGELDFSAGLTREISRHWFIGVEFRNNNELPEYDTWENTAFFIGPVVTFRQENWWVTVTALAQVYGKNYQNPDPDGKSNFELQGHEYLNVRCIIGISF